MRTADLDGDGRADLTVYRPSTGTWFNLQSKTNYTAFTTFEWGVAGDIPVSSDYDRRWSDRPRGVAAVERHVVHPSRRARTSCRPRCSSLVSTATFPSLATTTATAWRTSRSGGRRTGRGSSGCPRRLRARTCHSSGASLAMSRFRATTTATAKPTSPCGGRPRGRGSSGCPVRATRRPCRSRLGLRRGRHRPWRLRRRRHDRPRRVAAVQWHVVHPAVQDGLRDGRVDPRGGWTGRPRPWRLRRRRQDGSGGLAREQRHVVPAGVERHFTTTAVYRVGLVRRHPDSPAPVIGSRVCDRPS